MIICQGKIVDGAVVGVKESVKKQTHISEEEFLRLTEKLKDCLIYVQGTETSSYDNSDDDRAGCSSRQWSFGHYYEICPQENSKHLLCIDGEIRGVVFFIEGGRDIRYSPFLFDNSITNSVTLGYSASHSSNFTYIEKVSLVKRGAGGAPVNANKIKFCQNEMYPNI